MVANARPTPDDDAAQNPSVTGKAEIIQLDDGSGKSGRPRREFDLAHVRTLGEYAASHQEMASALSCSKNTITSRMDERGDFWDAYQEGLSKTKLKLRHRQIQLAMAGDGRMLTWLGMQLLGQRNKTTEDVNLREEKTVVFTIRQSPDEMEDGAAEQAQQRQEQEARN